LTTIERGIVRTASVSFVAFGTAIAMQGPVLPEIRHDLHVGNLASGAFIAAQGAGWASGALIGGPLSNRHGRRRCYVLGTLLLGTGMLAEALAPVAAVALLAVFTMMFGAGLITNALNAGLADVGPQAVLFANAFFGVGAIAGPLIAAALIASEPGWRAAPAIASAALFLTLFASGGVPPGVPEHSPSRRGAGALVRNRLYLLLIGVLGFEIAAETGLVGWFPTYAVDARDFAPWAAAASVAAFYVGTTAVRLLLARAGDIRPVRLLPGLTIAGTLATVGATLFEAPAALFLLLAAAGVAAGCVFPLVVSGVAEAFPHDMNVATGIALGTAGSLETLVPLAIGGSAAIAGTTTAGMVVVCIAWSASATAAVALRRVSRSLAAVPA
jgi:DHA1 family bicyclomycin/chloramphenicol resistance-like MFS transporter